MQLVVERLAVCGMVPIAVWVSAIATARTADLVAGGSEIWGKGQLGERMLFDFTSTMETVKQGKQTHTSEQRGKRSSNVLLDVYADEETKQWHAREEAPEPGGANRTHCPSH